MAMQSRVLLTRAAAVRLYIGFYGTKRRNSFPYRHFYGPAGGVTLVKSLASELSLHFEEIFLSPQDFTTCGDCVT